MTKLIDLPDTMANVTKLQVPATKVLVSCPYCGEVYSGGVFDPRGLALECAVCTGNFTIDKNPTIEIN